MRSFWGALRAYWVSDRWKEAWALTLFIIILTALNAKASVWLAETSGELVNAIAFLHENENPLRSLLATAGLLVALVVLKDAGFTGVRHLFSTTLHRKWRAWLDSRFNQALLDRNHTHFHVQHAGVDDKGRPAPAPDNVEQRVQESIKGMTGGALGLAMGVVGVFMSLFFVGMKLLETSTVVDGLEFLGEYGSVTLALLAVAIYVPLNTFLAVKLGAVLQRLNVRMQQAEGSYRGELNTLLRRSFHVAASHGEAVQRAIHQRLYIDIDRTWAKQNWFSAGYMSFELIYNFVAARVVAYGPSLVPYMHARIDLKGYVTGAELVNSLISQCSWFIHVMPEIATLRANARRVTDLAQAIENVQQPRQFYAQTGQSDFRFASHDRAFGLIVRNLELMHQGSDATPFVTARHLRFRRGEWTFVKGESGSGKTSLVRAVNGLWPYGRGSIVFPQGVSTFYAAQDVRLPGVTLKQLVCLPDDADDHSDARAAAALHKAGLGELIEFLGEDNKAGRPWDQILSGGQKQRLVAARIILQQPGVLFLDEATGALDPEARIAFHQAIKDNCPDVTVISIMHEAVPPRSATGEEFYHSVLSIADGVALKKPLAGLPAALTRLLSVESSGGAGRANRMAALRQELRLGESVAQRARHTLPGRRRPKRFE